MIFTVSGPEHPVSRRGSRRERRGCLEPETAARAHSRRRSRNERRAGAQAKAAASWQGSSPAAPRGGPLAAGSDESEQWLERAAGRCAAAPLISRRLHWPEPTPAPDDTRARRPCACRRPGRGRTPAAALERLVIVLRVAERTPPPPGRPSGHARTCERRTGGRRPPPRARAARYRRPSRGANGRPRPAAGPPSSSARRPGQLAVYMGCCPHRREGPVSCATLPSPSVIRTPDRGLLLGRPSGRLPKIARDARQSSKPGVSCCAATDARFHGDLGGARFCGAALSSGFEHDTPGRARLERAIEVVGGLAPSMLVSARRARPAGRCGRSAPW